jgi:hypothetical protein
MHDRQLLALVVLGIEVDDAGRWILRAPDGGGAVPADVQRIAALPELADRERVDLDVGERDRIDGAGAHGWLSLGAGIAQPWRRGGEQLGLRLRVDVRHVLPTRLHDVFGRGDFRHPHQWNSPSGDSLMRLSVIGITSPDGVW